MWLILEIVIERFSPALYYSLGMFLPLITVNCAILGGVLFGITRDYPLIPMLIFSLSARFGWWLAIALIAAIREKFTDSHVPKGLAGMGITFMTAGLMAMLGIDLARPTGQDLPIQEEDIFKTSETPISHKKTSDPTRDPRFFVEHENDPTN